MYDTRLTNASKGALVELCMSLNQYKREFVLAGGWPPYFLARKYFDHCGSVDIDLVLKPRIMRRYSGIREIVEKLGYRESPNPFRFSRELLTTDGRPFEMKLDFLTEPEAVMGLDFLTEVQEDLRACLIRGISVVFELNYEENVSAALPMNRGEAEVSLRVADVAGSLITKGLALPRLKDKDSYDIYAVAGFHERSPEGAAKAYRRILRKSHSSRYRPVVSESLGNIRNAFGSSTRYGCVAVSRFIGSNGRTRTDAFQRVSTFLQSIGSE